LILTPRSPGEPPFTIAKLNRTESGPTVTEIKRLHYDDYTVLKKACVRIDDFHATSDIYKIVQDNFAELDNLLHRIVRHRPPPEQEAVRRPVLRAVVNVASSFRMFADHLDRESKARLGEKYAAQVKTALSREYDASLSYRLCYELRNHAAHVGFPSLRTQVRSALKDDARLSSVAHTDESGVWVGILVEINKEKLLSDGRLKAAVRDEVRSLEGALELVGHLRNAVDGLERVHARYDDARAAVLAPDLSRLVDSIPPECVDKEEDVRLYEPPEPTGTGEGNFRVSYTRYPMTRLRAYWQMR